MKRTLVLMIITSSIVSFFLGVSTYRYHISSKPKNSEKEKINDRAVETKSIIKSRLLFKTMPLNEGLLIKEVLLYDTLLLKLSSKIKSFDSCWLLKYGEDSTHIHFFCKKNLQKDILTLVNINTRTLEMNDTIISTKKLDSIFTYKKSQPF